MLSFFELRAAITNRGSGLRSLSGQNYQAIGRGQQNLANGRSAMICYDPNNLWQIEGNVIYGKRRSTDSKAGGYVDAGDEKQRPGNGFEIDGGRCGFYGSRPGTLRERTIRGALKEYGRLSHRWNERGAGDPGTGRLGMDAEPDSRHDQPVERRTDQKVRLYAN